MYKVNPCIDDFQLDQNRTCSICDRVVVDLTNASEDEVIELYRANNGNLCGSVKSSYFNRSYYLAPFKRFAFSLLLVFGSSLFVLDACAQDSIQAIQQEVNLDSSYNADSLLIKGKVLDENGEAIFSAKVYFEEGGSMYGSITNFDGEYQIKLADYKWKNDRLTLKVKSIQYGSQEVEIYKKNKQSYTVNFEMSESELNLMGFIIMDHHSISKDPDAHRSTTITSEEIKRLPRK
ncbi:MAG: hypothetical protein ACI9N1_001973 [Flavobacteriales bacterium]|jgi:hypothetical protein